MVERKSGMVDKKEALRESLAKYKSSGTSLNYYWSDYVHKLQNLRGCVI